MFVFQTLLTVFSDLVYPVNSCGSRFGSVCLEHTCLSALISPRISVTRAIYEVSHTPQCALI